MNKKMLSILSGLLMAVLVFSNAFAGGGIKISGATFSLGSLVAKGSVSGIGNTNVIMVLDASGIPVIVCTNSGGNQVPGQSSPKVTAEGTQALSGTDGLRKNGKSPFDVETARIHLTWAQAGCPNSLWTAEVVFVFWTNATISVKDPATNAVLAKQSYVCKTTTTSVSCTAIN